MMVGVEPFPRSPHPIPVPLQLRHLARMSFEFENLDVYKKSVAWAATVEALTKTLRRQVSPSLLDQLTRAALSIPLNIAEGNGRWHKAEKRQFLWIARGSTFECVPILQVLRENGLIDVEQHSSFRVQLIEIGRMINGLLKSIEKLN